MTDQISRRTTLAGAAGLTALPVLAACGGSSGSDGSSGTAAETPTGPASAGTVVGPTSDIPVGGGKVYGKLGVVVTQPEAGTFKAFSATCTHQGCQVSRVSDEAIQCMCHFSKYSISDGAVEGGPAPEPLPAVDITVADGQVTIA
jgi:Rieske Fe-S protein